MNFLAKISYGNLDFGSHFNTARWHEFCSKNEGKYVKIERPIPIRSLTQNAFMWAWLTKVEMETGNDKDDLHAYLKAKFLPKRVIKIKGKQTFHELEVSGSTTNLSKNEFSEYLDKCAAHTGIPLPSEEELNEMGYIRN